ncbi:MAG: SIMPL domain-containing protein [bacterium]|nr:SIMPL domain-containing protein [bacterium]
MKNGSMGAAAVLGISVAIGLCVAGYFVADALYKVRAADRYVSVKGFAEREVDADLAIWPVSFNETANGLPGLYQKVEANRNVIHKFLLDSGFEEEEISDSAPTITDFEANQYGPQVKREYRYMAQAAVTLRSEKVAQVKKAMEMSGELVSKGIVLGMETYGRNSEFLFTGLKAVKPEMIAEATRNARKAAEQFAEDSGSKVGPIRTARQGLFTIQDRDRNSPDRKEVRVVTTVEYFLVGD